METVVSFPEKVSFFSLLAVIGVALGVNVMIVVVAFMKGFQHKFREDIIDAQGHARAIPLGRTTNWRAVQQELLDMKEVISVSPTCRVHYSYKNIIINRYHFL